MCEESAIPVGDSPGAQNSARGRGRPIQPKDGRPLWTAEPTSAPRCAMPQAVAGYSVCARSTRSSCSALVSFQAVGEVELIAAAAERHAVPRRVLDSAAPRPEPRRSASASAVRCRAAAPAGASHRRQSLLNPASRAEALDVSGGHLVKTLPPSGEASSVDNSVRARDGFAYPGGDHGQVFRSSQRTCEVTRGRSMQLTRR